MKFNILVNIFLTLAFAITTWTVQSEQTDEDNATTGTTNLVDTLTSTQTNAVTTIDNTNATNTTAGAETDEDYKIAPQDILVIDVFGEKDLSNREFRVSANGDISFPLIGEVKVANLTASQVNKKLVELLKDGYFVDPQVTVAVKEYSKRLVSVFGEVYKPGAIELPGEQKWTIVEAIAQAGGLKTTANKKKIKFTRNGKTQIFDFNELVNSKDPAKKIYLQPGDHIEVPQTLF
jgi:polysaccharide export outer membrane protein